MDFRNKVMEFSTKVPEIKKHAQTEVATKNALILPFLQLLCYDPFNPTEVCHEFTPNVANVLVEKFNIKPIGDLNEDIEAMMLGE